MKVIQKDWRTGFYWAGNRAPLFNTEREAVEYLFPDVVAGIIEDAQVDFPQYELDLAIARTDGWDDGYAAAKAIYEFNEE